MGRDLDPPKDGGPQSPKAISRRFANKVLASLARRNAVSTHHRLYDLRRTYVCHLLAGSTGADIPPAPVTFVARQIGDNPATVMKHYADWIPSTDRVWIERLETLRKAGLPARPWHQDGTTTVYGAATLGDGVRDVRENIRGTIGEPSGTRTQDPLIKSQVL